MAITAPFHFTVYTGKKQSFSEWSFYPNQERFGVGAKHCSLCDEATLPDTEHLMRTVSKKMNYFHQKL